MLATRVLSAFATLLLVAACSDGAKKPEQPSDAQPGRPRATAPIPPSQTPELPETGARDGDGNGLDDVLDARLRLAGSDAALLAERVEVQVLLNAPLEQAELDDFVADGGEVRYVFQQLSYGFIGSLPVGRLATLSQRYQGKLHLVAAPSVVVPFLDEATRTGRVRGIWSSGFAGSSSGYSGSSNITIGVLDTGVYEQHPDLIANKQGWKDYTSEQFAAPRDVEGHGTHVTSIALGTGVGFGVGPGTLRYTQSGNMSAITKNNFVVSAIHTPAYLGSGAALVVSAQAKFNGGVMAELDTMWADDGSNSYGAFGVASGSSPISLNNQNGGTLGSLYHGGLIQTDPAKLTNFAVANTVANYPAVGDGFNALRGVAPSCRWFGGKVFTDAGLGNSFDIEAGLDDMVLRKVTDNIKIINLSLGVSGSGTDPVMRTTVNNAVGAGVVVVVAAGNDYPLTIGDPGRASKVITVGAANDLNELTSYTSLGDTALPGASEDSKPDVLAPGGSAYRSQILAADTGTADGDLLGFTDMVSDDYASMQGTSMATPFVAGSVALMIDALQQSGTAWSFGSDAQPLLMKMLLLASATETNTNREHSTGSNPTLGRNAPLRDRFEGYGMINPDAAIEAMVQTFGGSLNGSVSNGAPARLEWERRSWGRNLSLVNGATVLLNLAVPSTGDFDLYLYSGTPNAKGAPVLRASSVNAGNNSDELINFVSSATETAYLFVKRVSGYGSFSLSGSAVSHCGDGDVDTGELCDPAAPDSAVCCTATCTTVADGSACTDGDKCTTDSCQSGVCASAPVVCAASDQCHNAGTCVAATGLCTNPQKANDSPCDDNNKCTQSDSCQAGTCTGASPVVCAASDQCHKAGTCAPATGACSNPQQNNGFACNDNNACTQSDSCQAGTCTGSSPVVCAASDQCHKAGTCAPATGMCSNPQQNNGFACDDGDKCTKTDTCQAGSCAAGASVACTALDQCHDPGTCAPGTGMCSNPNKNNGASCSDGNKCTATDTCQAGVCAAGSAVTCAASDQCHSAGACDLGTGNCTNPARANDTACDDGSLCTALDTCQDGTCTGVQPVVCAASDQCHVAGTCSPANGACSNPTAVEGTGCDDQDPCTLGDACTAGACQPAQDLACAPPDACHEPGVCDSQDGECKFDPKPNGTVCASDSTCQAGTCLETGAGGAGGDTGAGGEVGEAGEAGEAGVSGSGGHAQGGSSVGGSLGGSSTEGGSPVVAGSGAVTSGTAGGTVVPFNDEPHTSSGCSCQLPGAPLRSYGAASALALLALASRRRRRAA